MRRVLRCCVAGGRGCRGVIDGVYVDPKPASAALLQDLTFEDLARYFPRTSVHAACGATEEPKFALSATDRALTLMPVTTRTGDKETTAWAPFLIDCGSPGTFFAAKTIEALKLGEADHVAIMGKQVLWHQSTGHFDDINLLGTSFLRGGELRIRYAAGEVSFTRAAASAVWVTDGKEPFQVAPKQPTVAALKVAIAEFCGWSAADPATLIIKDPATGAVMGGKDAIHASTEYGFELPPASK